MAFFQVFLLLTSAKLLPSRSLQVDSLGHWLNRLSIFLHALLFIPNGKADRFAYFLCLVKSSIRTKTRPCSITNLIAYTGDELLTTTYLNQLLPTTILQLTTAKFVGACIYLAMIVIILTRS